VTSRGEIGRNSSITEAQIPFGSSRRVSTRHQTFDVHFGCVELVTTRSTRSTRRTCRVVSRRDEPSGIWA